MVLDLFGPVEGRRHDMHLFRQSGIEDDLQRALVVGGRQYYIYGDPAYVLRPYLQVGYHGTDLTIEQKAFNASMSSVRISVEWAFKDVKKYFTHLAFPRKLVLGNTPAAKWYICAAVLWNFRNCMSGSEKSQFYKCDPPTIDEYISNNFEVN
jgi:nuclease HARBI1